MGQFRKNKKQTAKAMFSLVDRFGIYECTVKRARANHLWEDTAKAITTHMGINKKRINIHSVQMVRKSRRACEKCKASVKNLGF